MPYFFDPPYYLRLVTLVGLGGTGSALAKLLARILYDMKRAQMHVPNLRFIDPDKVEHKNCGRQNFCEADVGLYKAEILAKRFNYALGLDIAWLTQPVDAAHHFEDSSQLVIGAVDNAAARRELAKVHGVWIDCGNHFSAGQVTIGDTSDVQLAIRALQTRDEAIHHLPNAALLFPQLLEPEPVPSLPTPPTASCADLVATGEQHLLVNEWMATIAAQYVYKLLHRQRIESFVTYVELESLNVRSIRICLDELRPYLSPV